MRINIYAKCVFNCFFNSLNSRVTKLDNLFDFLVGIFLINHQMIVLFIEIRFLVRRRCKRFLAKLVFADEACIKKNFDGVINGGFGDMVFFLHHEKIQIINIEMMLHRVDFL